MERVLETVWHTCICRNSNQEILCFQNCDYRFILPYNIYVPPFLFFNKILYPKMTVDCSFMFERRFVMLMHEFIMHKEMFLPLIIPHANYCRRYNGLNQSFNLSVRQSCIFVSAVLLIRDINNFIYVSVLIKLLHRICQNFRTFYFQSWGK